MSAETRDLVRGIFVIEALGPQTLKGMPRPIEAFRAVQPTGVRSRLDVSPERLTPLIGRTREVARLMELWEEVRSGGGRAVLITGEAGGGELPPLAQGRGRLRRQSPHPVA